MQDATTSPRPLPDAPEPLELLARVSLRLANAVEAISRRRDVRDTRSRLLLLLLELRCPPGSRPRRSWYVPGAVARLGVEALRRAWRAVFHVEPPSARRLRGHLGVLERCCLLIRAPGDWLETLTDEGSAFRPRHPDTIHVLDDERSAAWWKTEGASVLRRHPAVRRNPDAWGRLLGRWRSFLGSRQLEFAFGSLSGMRETDLCGEVALADPAEVRRMAGELAAARTHLDSLTALQRGGVELSGRAWVDLASANPPRLRAAGALLTRALMRGDRVRNRGGWLLRVYRNARLDELRAAAAWLARFSHDSVPRIQDSR